MRHFRLYFVASVLLTACGDDKPREPSTETVAPPRQQDERIAGQPGETPRSLSGSEGHMGPSPHAELSSAQHIAVALQHAEQGRMEEALDVLGRAIAASPNDASLIGAVGGLLLSQDRVAEALVYLEKAVTLAPNSAVLRVNRSQAYRKFNLTEEAMRDLDEAVALSSKLVPARFNRGVLLYGEARYEEALADFDACIQVAPETAGPYFNRAVTRYALGDRAGAVSDMHGFIERSDNPEWTTIARDTLAAWEESEPSQ